VKKLPKKIEDASDRAFREKYQSGGGRWSGGLEGRTRAGLAALPRSLWSVKVAVNLIPNKWWQIVTNDQKLKQSLSSVCMCNFVAITHNKAHKASNLFLNIQ
jgi:hypothetical protein